MRDTRFTRSPFELIAASGRRAAFGSLYRLCDHLAGRHPSDALGDLVGMSLEEAPYLVRGCDGAPLCAGTLTLYLAGRGGRLAAHAGERGTFRRGPWPGSGWKRSHRGAYYRRVRTRAALAYEAAVEPDLVELGWHRPARGRALPTYRDDVARHTERCWKRHRATQYK